MTLDIDALVHNLPLVDVHEHHMPEITRSRDVGLLQLLRQSYAAWARERPYALPGERRDEDPMPGAAAPGSWRDIAPFVEESGSNAFVRNLLRGLAGLYELGDEGVTRANWEELDARIRERHADPGWPDAVLDRAGVLRVITDPYTDPLLDAREALGERYLSVLRINALACGWHPASRDHNGNSAHELAARLDLAPGTFEEYVDFLETLVDTMESRHQVALKNALAYDRDLAFDPPDELLARRAWGRERPSAGEKKAFGDFVVDRLCALAGERDVPVQVHLGTARIRGSHPMHVAGLIERHPRTRFLLMHLAYPWSRDLLGIAFVYRNVWLDLTWSLLLSPSHFQLALHEAIEVLPDERRLMIGGDNWHVEETWATVELARRLVARVLREKVGDGYLRAADAERLARRIFRANAEEFFGLSG